MKRLFSNIDLLLPGLIGMILLAYFLPFREQYQEIIPMKPFLFWGIVGVFFMYGMKLKPRELLRDISNWKLHVLAQGATFLLFPIFVLLLYPILKATDFEKYWIALFFLSVLPSTVTMSVVFVEKMKGNFGGAIFNSSISGLLGILFTPLWLGLFLNETGASPDYLDIFWELVKKILIPLIVGMLFRYFWSEIVQNLLFKLKYFDKIVIMFIVYNSFSSAFEKELFTGVSIYELVLLLAVVVSLHLTIFESLGFIGKLFKLPAKDQTVLLFCGSQKSLVHGSIFVLFVFSDAKMQSFVLIPLMFYHAFQLLYASYKVLPKKSTKNTL